MTKVKLPQTIAFVSKEDAINVNGNMTNQHPINNGEFNCHPMADYNNYCSVEDFKNFDFKGFLNNPDKKKPRLIKKTNKEFVYKDSQGKVAALIPTR